MIISIFQCDHIDMIMIVKNKWTQDPGHTLVLNWSKVCNFQVSNLKYALYDIRLSSYASYIFRPIIADLQWYLPLAKPESQHLTPEKMGKGLRGPGEQYCLLKEVCRFEKIDFFIFFIDNRFKLNIWTKSMRPSSQNCALWAAINEACMG